MEKEKKFRNHISIVAEEFGGGFFAVLAALCGYIIKDIDELSEIDFSFAGHGRWLLIFGAAVLFLLALIVRKLRIWSKTWISIQGQAVIIEKDTVNKTVNTIAVRNISNINTEQNLFEMLMGTCKVKMDTNSASTADKTDVKIVLKKAEAEAFRLEVLRLMREQEGSREEAGKENGVSEEKENGGQRFLEDGIRYDITADTGDIIKHGLYSVRIFSVLLTLAGVAGAAASIIQIVQNPDFIKQLLSAAAGILVAAGIVCSAVWDTVKDFIRYYDFRVKRSGDRLYIRYGILKKVSYTIPVDKIQAIELNQSFVARLSGRYMAEIINIGMGDEAEEKHSFLLLYGTKEEIREQLLKVLPEFADVLEHKVKKQPAKTWAAWMPVFGLYEIAVLASGMLCAHYLSDYAKIVYAAAAVLAAIGVMQLITSYLTDGVRIGQDYLRVDDGWFAKTHTAVRYDRIQHLEIKANFAARSLGICRGELYLLAGASDKVKTIPYFKAEGAEKLKKKILENEAGL